MQSVQTYVDDSDHAVLATIASGKGLSTSALVRMLIRAACDAAPSSVKTNAAAALQEAKENAGSLSVEDLANAPWAGSIDHDRR
jgi:hypothetical protein